MCQFSELLSWRHFINSVKLCLWLILHYLDLLVHSANVLHELLSVFEQKHGVCLSDGRAGSDITSQVLTFVTNVTVEYFRLNIYFKLSGDLFHPSLVCRSELWLKFWACFILTAATKSLWQLLKVHIAPVPLWDYSSGFWIITEHNLQVLIRPGSVDPDNLHRWTPLCDVWS